MLTIVIFSNGRYNYLIPLLHDIVQSNIKTKIQVINYGQQNKIKIKPFLKNKNIQFIIGKSNETFAERFFNYIKNIKTKYVWIIGDDDRIETKYLKPLINFLKFKNNSGFSLNYSSFHKNNKIKKNKEILQNIKFESFDLLKNISNLGTLGTLIINANSFKKISKSLNKKILLNYGYPQIYIALKLITKFKDWKFIKNKILFYRYGNFEINNKNLEIRLNMEFNGYFATAKEIFGIKSKMYKKIFRIIFFRNILSWIILAIEVIGKEKTQVIINNNRTLIPNFWWINLIFYLIYKTPVKFLVFIKKLKNFIKLQYEKYLTIVNYRA
jgi:hypothetical protein